MGTTSRINVRNRIGKYVSIQCFLDGYLNCNGKILLKCYTQESKMNELMMLGHLYTLGVNIINEHDKLSYCEISSNQFLYEDNEQPLIDLTEFPITDCDYNYLFLDGAWYWNKRECEYWNNYKSDSNIIINGDSWRLLTDEDILNCEYWNMDEEDEE